MDDKYGSKFRQAMMKSMEEPARFRPLNRVSRRKEYRPIASTITLLIILAAVAFFSFYISRGGR